MKCPKCGVDNHDDSVCCSACGISLGLNSSYTYSHYNSDQPNRSDDSRILLYKARIKKMMGAGLILIGLIFAAKGFSTISNSGYDQYGNYWTTGGSGYGLLGIVGLFGFVTAGALLLLFGYYEITKLRISAANNS
jgi:hypothetical protein